jgi:hypothetical protein
MIRSGIAFLTLIACASVARAELVVHELGQQPSTAEIVDFLPLAQGDLLLRTRSGASSVVYVLAPDGTLKERWQTPWDASQSLVPYRNGFAMQRLAEIVAFEHAADVEPEVIYTVGAPFERSQLYASPDGQDLYVFETGSSASRVTRIDASGERIAWPQTIARLDSTIIATDDGLAFVKRPYDRTLCAMDRNGRLRWETSVPQMSSGEPIYSAAGFITLPVAPASPGEWDQARLLNFDIHTGQLVADVHVPAFISATGTSHGIILSGWMLGQRYVGLVQRDGKLAWLRRYVPDQKISDIQHAAAARDGKLLFVTRERVSTSVTAPTSIVVTDSTGASLAEGRGSCLVTKWQRPVELTTRLEKHGLRVLPPKAEELGWSGPRCADKEEQFVHFLQSLAAAVPPTAKQPPRQTIAVRVTFSDKRIRLENYDADRSGYYRAMVMLGFAVPHDRASEFWKIVTTQVQPHLARMKAFDERFVQTTGYRYHAAEHGDLDPAHTFADLEKAARIVDERIAQIPRAQLVEVLEHPPVGEVGVWLQLDGFGGGEGRMEPFDVADRTFLDIVAEHRRRAAQGEIVIRD